MHKKTELSEEEIAMINMFGVNTSQNTTAHTGSASFLKNSSKSSDAATEEHKDSFLSRVKDYCGNYVSDVKNSIERNGWVSTVFKGMFHGLIGSFLGGMAGSFLGGVVGGPVGALIGSTLSTAGGVGGFLHGLKDR